MTDLSRHACVETYDVNRPVGHEHGALECVHQAPRGALKVSVLAFPIVRSFAAGGGGRVVSGGDGVRAPCRAARPAHA